MNIIDFFEWLIKAPYYCCAWVIVGAIAGALARRLMAAEDKPLWSDLLLGLAGALVGFFVTGSILGIDTDTGGLMKWVVTLVVAVIGAMVLIFIGRTFWGNRGKRRSPESRSKRISRRR